MTQATETQTEKEMAIQLFNKPVIIEKFRAILQGGTNAFIQSALICIADNTRLMECTPQSLVKGALRSATLNLSLDPALRQGFLVPRKDKKSGGAWVASFQPHYNGLYQLAQRTGKYRAINVSPIHQGERVFENVQTGLHGYVPAGTSILAAPQNQISFLDTGYRDVTSGKNTEPIIGYLAYFKTMEGLEKSVWMTIKEIHEHAQRWAPENYASEYGAWKDKRKLPTMEMKTVFLALTKFMDLSGERNAVLKAAIQADADSERDDDDTIDAEAEEVPAAQQPQPTPQPQPAAQTKTQAVEFICPTSKPAIEYAAKAWNVTTAEALNNIQRAKKPATMKKTEFQNWVDGLPKADNKQGEIS